ncbi:MAG: ABC transporter substrate-binding protein [Synergistaceae bacterium]|jgi:peptide/nickel transport system substrate-binding protein|nr:ABC transporter substrate-binding protein [Synergistaceae bacterium]
MGKKCRKSLCWLFLGIVVVSLAAAGLNAATAASKRADRLTIVLSADPANLDPNDSDSQFHYQTTRNIYETLFVYDENYDIAPWLCEKYEFENDSTIILHLRKGVKFHNGDEFKASDVYFTIKRSIDNRLASMVEFSNVLLDKCEVIDDYTFKLVTNGPVATQIPLLENPAASIMSERAFKEAKGDFVNGACVGTGPFQFVSYAPGDQVTLKAFDGYWREGEPHFDNLLIRFISDSASRAIEAETGGADIVYDIGAKDLGSVDAANGVHIVAEVGTNTSHLLMNTAVAPLDNDLVRQAVWYGVDASVAVKLAYGNFGAVANDWVCPGIKGANPDLAASYFPKRDVAKAKKSLADAGYPNGIELEIAVPSSQQERCDMAEVFQAQLAEVGIKVKVNIMEYSAWNAYILSGKQQMTIYGFSAADFEADRALVQFMPTNVNYNLCQFDNKEFQDIVAKSFVTLDTEERARLYRDAIVILMKNHITVPLWFKALNAAVKDDIEGFRITRSYEHHYLQYVSRTR